MLTLALAFAIPVGMDLFRAFIQGGFILCSLVMLSVLVLVQQADSKLTKDKLDTIIAEEDYHTDINLQAINPDEQDAMGRY
jgi:hypothetical protein